MGCYTKTKGGKLSPGQFRTVTVTSAPPSVDVGTVKSPRTLSDDNDDDEDDDDAGAAAACPSDRTTLSSRSVL